MLQPGEVGEQESMQGPIAQPHLGLDCLEPNHREVLSRLDGRIEEGRLSDSGLAPEHQGATHPLPYLVKEGAELRNLLGSPDQHLSPQGAPAPADGDDLGLDQWWSLEVSIGQECPASWHVASVRATVAPSISDAKPQVGKVRWCVRLHGDRYQWTSKVRAGFDRDLGPCVPEV